MPLHVGSRLGHYDVTALIGEGDGPGLSGRMVREEVRTGRWLSPWRLVVGVVLALFGVAGVISPRSLVKLVQGWESSTRFRFAVAGRLLVGVVFVAVAPDCRVPGLVQVVGGFSILGAVVVLMLGRAGGDALVESWLKPTLVRVVAPVAVAGGALLIYAGPVSAYDVLNPWL